MFYSYMRKGVGEEMGNKEDTYPISRLLVWAVGERSASTWEATGGIVSQNSQITTKAKRLKGYSPRKVDNLLKFADPRVGFSEGYSGRVC